MLLVFMMIISSALGAIMTFTVPTSIPTTNTPSSAVLFPQVTPRAVASTTAIPVDDFISTKHIIIPGVTNSHVTLAPHTIEIAIPTCVQTITPDKNGYVPPGTCNALWNYYPKFAAALIFAILFGALTMVHVWQASAYKKKFCWVVIMGAFWETAAFTFRTISTRHQQSMGVYLVFQIFILLAPLWINAFIYMVLGRMIHFTIPSRSLYSISASTLAIMFVSLDFVSFIIQLVGGSWAGPTSPPSRQMQGIHIYMGGIGLQQFFILIFLVLAVKFHSEMLKMEKLSTSAPLTSSKRRWRPLLYTLYGTLGLITTRILFRLVEFASGHEPSNPIPFHEAYFYVLEAVPMFLAVLAFNVIHPGSFLVGPESELPGVVMTIRAVWGRRKGKEMLLDGGETDRIALT